MKALNGGGGGHACGVWGSSAEKTLNLESKKSYFPVSGDRNCEVSQSI